MLVLVLYVLLQRPVIYDIKTQYYLFLWMLLLNAVRQSSDVKVKGQKISFGAQTMKHPFDLWLDLTL